MNRDANTCRHSRRVVLALALALSTGFPRPPGVLPQSLLVLVAVLFGVLLLLLPRRFPIKKNAGWLRGGRICAILGLVQKSSRRLWNAPPRAPRGRSSRGDADLTVPRVVALFVVCCTRVPVCVAAPFATQRRAQDGGQLLSRERDIGGELLLDGPELRGPELGAMRRRGVRRHAQLGHEPRDGHVQVVP